jgi:hypothetical protein
MSKELSELDKWENVYKDHGKLNEFLDFLNEQGLTICTLHKDTESFLPTLQTRVDMLAQYFNIDLGKLDIERKQLLDDFRKNSMKN